MFVQMRHENIQITLTSSVFRSLVKCFVCLQNLPTLTLKSIPLNSTEQANSVNELTKNNYVLQVLEIKTMTTSSSKRVRTKSASDKGVYFSQKGNLTPKSP